ncbi:MAG TPA: ABC transporter permease [Tepidisphaeraceae bacterium]|jgi:lipopolysaccharide transport system permease protein
MPDAITGAGYAQERLVLEPVAPLALPDFIEIWRHRDLLLTLAARDLKVRYKQTALGVLWIVLQPLLGAGILTYVFGEIANVRAPGGLPIFLLSFSGMVVWSAFSSTISRTASALIGNAQLISKVYFPRLILPLSTILSTLVDVLVMLPMLAIFCIVYRWQPPWTIVFFPWFILIAMALGSGIGTWMAGLAVKYRDVQYVLPVITQTLFWASPIAYGASRVGKHRTLYFLNPLAGTIEGFRWSVLGVGFISPWEIFYTAATAAVAMAVGYFWFSRMERSFADVI